MRQLDSISTDIVELEVYECDCGFHIGLDGTFIEQIHGIQIACPSCGRIIDTDQINP